MEIGQNGKQLGFFFILGVNAPLVPIFYIFFFLYFSPYIFISPLLIPKSINAFHFGPSCYSLNRNCWYG